MTEAKNPLSQRSKYEMYFINFAILPCCSRSGKNSPSEMKYRWDLTTDKFLTYPSIHVFWNLRPLKMTTSAKFPNFWAITRLEMLDKQSGSCGLRSLDTKQRKTEEWDFRFWQREKWNESQKMIFYSHLCFCSLDSCSSFFFPPKYSTTV